MLSDCPIQANKKVTRLSIPFCMTPLSIKQERFCKLNVKKIIITLAGSNSVRLYQFNSVFVMNKLYMY